jgi:hypothetical protein
MRNSRARRPPDRWGRRRDNDAGRHGRSMRGEEPGKLGQDLAPTARRPACLGCWQWREGTLIYFERKHDCEVRALKPECCKDGPARKIARSLHEAAWDQPRAIAGTRPTRLRPRTRRGRCSRRLSSPRTMNRRRARQGLFKVGVAPDSGASGSSEAIIE